MPRHLDDWLTTYLQYTAHSEAPEVFHTWTGVSTIAGALRRCVWIDQIDFQWTPNFYIILVAPAAVVSKTTAIKIGRKLLQEIKNVRFGPQAVTWQALVQSMAKSMDAIQINGKYIPMSAVTISSGELGSPINPYDREMIDVLTDLWDGQEGTWEKATKTQGKDIIQNPWINIISATTPAWIGDHMPSTMKEAGFISRCIFIFASRKRHISAYVHKKVDKNHHQLKLDLIHDLEMISMMRGEYKLTPEAEAWGEKWYENVYYNEILNVDVSSLGGFIGRKQTHMHKTAIVVAASRRNELIITLEDLQTADKMIKTIEPNMQRVFDALGPDDKVRKAGKVVETMKRVKLIRAEQLYKLLCQDMGFDDYKLALDSALASGRIVNTVIETKAHFRYIGVSGDK